MLGRRKSLQRTWIWDAYRGIILGKRKPSQVIPTDPTDNKPVCWCGWGFQFNHWWLPMTSRTSQPCVESERPHWRTSSLSLSLSFPYQELMISHTLDARRSSTVGRNGEWGSPQSRFVGPHPMLIRSWGRNDTDNPEPRPRMVCYQQVGSQATSCFYSVVTDGLILIYYDIRF